MRLSVSLLILFIPLIGLAQSGSYPPGGTQGSPGSGLSIIFGNSDSLEANYFSIEDPSLKQEVDFLKEMPATAQYDPIKLQTIDHVNLGNAGSSAFPIHYSWNPNINFDLGYHQYDIYKKNLKNTRIIKTNTPLSNLGFSPISGRENFVVDAFFSNSYKEQLTMNVDYKRINQNGYFQNQATKSTNVGFHLYWSPKSSYSALLSFFVNNNNEGQNGGITTDTLFGIDFYENLITIPVFSTDASARYQNRAYVLNQYYSLTRDSSLVHFDIHHQIEYESGYYRYFDNTIGEMEYFQYPNFLSDERGIRHIVNYKHLKNDIDFTTTLNKDIELRSGISQNYYSTDDELVNYSVNEISAFGNLNVKLYDRFNLSTKLQIGLINNNGNLSFESKALLKLPGSNLLEGGFNFSRYASSYLQRNLTITQNQIWADEYNKQIETEIWASIYLRKLKTKITGSQMLLDNKIYLISNQSYFQDDEIHSFSKMIIENKIDFKRLHLENTFLLQTFSNNIFNLPGFWAKNIFYINLDLFGDVVDSNFGIESRLTPERDARFYHPILGDVFSTTEKFEFYPDISLFGVFDVNDFRVFIRAENFSSVLDNAKHYHFLAYPQNEFKIRFGFRWLLTN